MGAKIMPVSDLRRKISQTLKELQHATWDEAIYIARAGRRRSWSTTNIMNNSRSKPETG